MNFFQALFLGTLQGLTEFIPVSSSGHLVLAQHFWGIESEGNLLFELFMHLGTLLAVVVFFRKSLCELISSLFSWRNTINREIHRKNRNVILYLIISTICTGFFYLVFGDYVKPVYQMPQVVAVLLLVTGCIVFVSDYFKEKGIPVSNMGFMRAILIGLGQGIALLPGISRSGTTIATSLGLGIKRKDAAQFSFLLSIPAILGANASEFSAFLQINASAIPGYIGGFISAFIVGYFVIAFLISLIEHNQLKYIAFYCWAIGVIASVLLAMGL